jgi:tetratricopeptide (TPR) repeat protein
MKHSCIIVLLAIVCLPSFPQSSNTDSVVDAAISWRNSGNSFLAVKQLDELVAMDKNNDRALYELAYTHLLSNNITLAMINAGRVVKMGGAYGTDAGVVLAQCYIARGELRRAMRELNKLPDNDSRVPYNKALVFYKEGKLEEAGKFAQKAIADDKTFADAHLLLSYICLDSGERLKSMLPLYYYLLLNNDTGESAEAVAQLNGLWAPGSGRLISRKKEGQGQRFYAGADAFIESLTKNDGIPAKGDGQYIERLTRLTKGLFDYLKSRSDANFDFYQIAYSDFFIQLFDQGYTDSFVNYICYQPFKASVLEWISGHGSEFDNFRIWMEAR